MRLQGVNDIVKVAVHDRQQFVQRQVDAVVGQAPLRKVVGADAVAAVATANQTFALGSIFGGALAAVFFLDAGGQHLERLGFVAVLAAPVLAFGHDAGGQVGDAHRRVGFVDVLATRTAGAVGIDAQICRIDLDGLRLVGLGQHGNGAGAGVDAALGFGDRHALHPVPAGLELERTVDLFAVNAQHHFLVATKFAD
ncbi:hypothetical protein GALL_496600 [mine drainage metagenome]|uniref:Uncharacterized protein n=1 Tax=mine drainage metagenome TaxID=410659 RepID=A0A1J5PBN7_9ZZZZ